MLPLLLIFLLPGMFSVSMCATLGRDENMYLTAGVLSAQGQCLYRDFGYLQMPYLPLLYGFVFTVSDTTMYLLTGRLIQFLVIALSAWLVYTVVRHVSESQFVATVCLGFFCLNRITIHDLQFAWNQDLPVMLTVMAIGLLFSMDAKCRWRWGRLFLCGAAVGLAVGVKLTFATVPLVFVWVLSCGGWTPSPPLRRGGAVAMFLAGMLVALLPVARYVRAAGWDVFAFNNLGYHLKNTIWRIRTGYPIAISHRTKITYLIELAQDPVVVVIALCVGLMMFLVARQSRFVASRLWRDLGWRARCAALLCAVSMATAYQPTPSFVNYYALALTAAIVQVGCLWPRVHRLTRPVLAPALGCGLLLSVLFGGYNLHEYTTRLLRPHTWTGIYIHRAAVCIGDRLDQVGVTRPVATQSPVFAIEGGAQISTEFATGAFLYRIGDLLTQDERRRYKCTSLGSVGERLKHASPGAIIVGFESYGDRQLEEFATQHGYTAWDQRFCGGMGVLYTLGETPATNPPPTAVAR